MVQGFDVVSVWNESSFRCFPSPLYGVYISSFPFYQFYYFICHLCDANKIPSKRASLT